MSLLGLLRRSRCLPPLVLLRSLLCLNPHLPSISSPYSSVQIYPPHFAPPSFSPSHAPVRKQLYLFRVVRESVAVKHHDLKEVSVVDGVLHPQLVVELNVGRDSRVHTLDSLKKAPRHRQVQLRPSLGKPLTKFENTNNTLQDVRNSCLHTRGFLARPHPRAMIKTSFRSLVLSLFLVSSTHSLNPGSMLGMVAQADVS
eukprot:3073026-Rhodomonas_salina.1